MQADLLYLAPAKREDQKIQRGRARIAPEIYHPLRVKPSRGLNNRGEPIPGDYIATDRPLSIACTSEVVKDVSRPDLLDPLNRLKRKMRAKTTKIKFRLLEDWEVTESIRRNVWYYGDKWSEEMFKQPATVHYPGEMEPAVSG